MEVERRVRGGAVWDRCLEGGRGSRVGGKMLPVGRDDERLGLGHFAAGGQLLQEGVHVVHLQLRRRSHGLRLFLRVKNRAQIVRKGERGKGKRIKTNTDGDG